MSTDVGLLEGNFEIMSQQHKDKGVFTQVPNSIMDTSSYPDLNIHDRWVLICRMRVCWKEGYHKITIREIATIAGVAPTTLCSTEGKKSVEGILDRLARYKLIEVKKARPINKLTRQVGREQTYIKVLHDTIWQNNVACPQQGYPDCSVEEHEFTDRPASNKQEDTAHETNSNAHQANDTVHETNNTVHTVNNDVHVVNDTVQNARSNEGGNIYNTNNTSKIRERDDPTVAAVQTESSLSSSTSSFSSEKQEAITKSPPPPPPAMPPEEAPWDVDTCLHLFEARRGRCIPPSKRSWVRKVAAIIVDRATRRQTEQIDTAMNQDPYWIERGGADIVNVASNIDRELNKLEYRQRSPSAPATATPASEGATGTTQPQPTIRMNEATRKRWEAMKQAAAVPAVSA